MRSVNRQKNKKKRSGPSGMATLIAPDMPSPAEDAETIRKACLGWGTDEKAIIGVLAHRTTTQRKLIRLAYEQIYQEDLIHQLKSELSGHFEKAICAWVLDPAERDAVLANIAIENGGEAPDYRALVEISCVRSPEELLAVKRAYKSRFKHCIEEDVASHATGNMRKLLVALISSFRYDGIEVNERLANREAYNLSDEFQSNLNSSNFEELVRVLTTRSKPQLRATFNHYKDISGTSITKSLKNNPDCEFSAALRLTIRCIKNPTKFLEKVLRNAINGLGTDKYPLSRVIVTRAEVDLQEIKELYFKRNNVPLDQAVANDTSGDYRDFLLALLGSQQF